jgi:hypothetical protein
METLKQTAVAAVLSLVLVMSSQAQTTTQSQQCDTCNNTSAITGAFDTSNGDAATWNISKVPTRSALYAGATTKVYMHWLPWFCTSPVVVGSDGVSRCGGHILTGYNSNDATVVHNQLTDMISRGGDGVIIDWYTKTTEDQAAMKVRDEAAQHAGFEFAIMEDKENYKSAGDQTARANKIIQDVQYINSTYFNASAYMKRGARPVLFFFQIDTQYPVDWAAVAAGVQQYGNPLLVFENNFDHAAADGAYAWIDTSNPTMNYLNDYYSKAQTHPTKIPWGSSYAGFNDALATWGLNRFVDRRCGNNWMDAFASANGKWSSSNQLPNLQLVTWNDYDEGTEIESGIDNGESVTGSITSNTLNWSISGCGGERTIYSYRIFTSDYPDTQNWTQRGEVLARSTSPRFPTATTKSSCRRRVSPPSATTPSTPATSSEATARAGAW